MNVLQKITLVSLPADQYLTEDSSKNQIYVHHTASSTSPYGVLDWWKTTPERVGTAFIVGGPTTSTKWKDGDIIQCFGSAKWAWHLGLKAEHLHVGGSKAKTNTDLNKNSIGIEICNWGQLSFKNGKFLSYANEEVPKEQVVEYDVAYRGYKFYHKYSAAQLDVVHDLLGFLCDKWNIDKTYQGDRIFDICPDALQGKPGIFSHVSVRPDKFDCHPQVELKQMLQSI
jgi:N-acetyl-anhydromuramyl-L-alanine amidase AmpD